MRRRRAAKVNRQQEETRREGKMFRRGEHICITSIYPFLSIFDQKSELMVSSDKNRLLSTNFKGGPTADDR
ncbi:hypothetical protein HYPSUDRAFT_1008562 [Hypholoma sublateritium FD-334 SS-4]|uniref:Uncharacterized protein n=1 Tax=Hypholoma sublateritium (strain FD-334 SS-4) TaxID=945553 RepID=A0A0D2PBM6_HYPSF|nr:hypothetical protein HYPSUDRAFT_1008562 [Hypholoma sublateritium FD-334 SS-4]